MNIGIDARPLVRNKVGFGFFLKDMLDAILSIDKTDKFYLFSDREVEYESSRFSNVTVVQYKDNIFCPKSFYYYYKLPSFIKDQGIELDVFWGTMHLMPEGFDTKVRKILTIHDFTHIKFPEATTKYNLLITKLFFEASIKNTNQIICISKNTERELRQYYAGACIGKSVKTIYEGGYENGECESCDILQVRDSLKELRKCKYILFVGTIEPRKNIQLLLEAATKMNGRVKIVVCGKIGWEKKKIIEQLYHTDNLIYFDYVNQDEKIFLMKHAFCQVQPSLYEGFGLPVVESMQAGTVVVVADNSSLSELVGLNDLKFETQNVDDFSEKIKHLLDDDSLYKKAKEYCTNRGKEFSWGDAASRYIETFYGNNNE